MFCFYSKNQVCNCYCNLKIIAYTTTLVRIAYSIRSICHIVFTPLCQYFTNNIRDIYFNIVSCSVFVISYNPTGKGTRKRSCEINHCFSLRIPPVVFNNNWKYIILDECGMKGDTLFLSFLGVRQYPTLYIFPIVTRFLPCSTMSSFVY